MAKIFDVFLVPVEDSFVTVLAHYGPFGFWDPTVIHAIYWYPALSVPVDTAAFHFHDTEVAAELEAKAWVSMPRIGMDICPLCRSMSFGPNLPRWNIYHYPNAIPVPRTVLWDAWLGPPPEA